MSIEPIQESLRELVAYGGDSLLADPDLMYRTLAGRHSGELQRVQWLVTTQRGGVVRRLREIEAPLDPELAAKFAQYLALAEKMGGREAKWSVDTWAFALGKAELTLADPALNVPQSAFGTPRQYIEDDLLSPIPGSSTLAGPVANPAADAYPSWGAPLPPPMWPLPPVMPFGNENTSGLKGIVPSEIEGSGFSWGAAVLTPFWLIAHNLQLWGVLLLVGGLFIPGLGLIAAFYFGFRGNHLAWQNRRFDSVAQYKVIQQAWNKAAIVATVVGVLLSIVVCLFLVPIVIARTGGTVIIPQ